ncbi:N-acetylmuramoyl-L-alanine amidase [Bacillus sp. OK048]|uniref:N-acetylmuramoyl-L-alanine amidase n=1 Tax=Bacillus sp. OK048 TaxID=1882761 RepID=UPI000888DEEE|nr:N-acetylmuramoyl-L-alanine amidase [Bacillus sp. OK048]SDM17038.1 N-acetylmuramoyl-L-alanine amidase [Bacillus sp. OK048]
MVKVYWDKGHGGTDPGAVGNGLQEKVLTRKIVEYAMAFLDAHYIVEQRCSRSGDESKTLKQRTDDANSWGANLLVSVHINSAASASANGFESHIYPNAGVATVSFQNMLHAEIMQVMRAFGVTNDRGKKQSNFHMLRESKMVACLTENLFIVNAYDANRLKQEEFLKAVGEAHARCVLKFLGLAGKPVPQPVPTPQSVPQPANATRRVKIIDVSSAAILMDKPDRINGANIGTIPKGAIVDMVVPVAGFNNGNTGYYKVVYNGKTGYINAKFGQEV